jgi:hypothetical protein
LCALQRLRTAGRLLDATAFKHFKEEYEFAMHLASIVEGAQDAIMERRRPMSAAVRRKLSRLLKQLWVQGKMSVKRKVA